MARPRIDASIDYRLTPRVSLFLWGRNIFNDRDKSLVYGALTPDYAKYSVESDYGVIFQAGVKGSW
jgi:outer membrane receptor protein involved in Fe transport